MSQIVRWMFQLSLPLNHPYLTYPPPTHTKKNKDYWGLLSRQTWLTFTISSPLTSLFLWGVHPVKDPWNFLSQIVFVPIYENYIGCRQSLFLQNLQDRAFQNLNARASNPRRKLVSMKHLPATKSSYKTEPSRSHQSYPHICTNPQSRNIQPQKTECVSRYNESRDGRKIYILPFYAEKVMRWTISQRMNLQHTVRVTADVFRGSKNLSTKWPTHLRAFCKHDVCKRSKMASSHWHNNLLRSNWDSETCKIKIDLPMQSLDFSFAKLSSKNIPPK